MKKIVCTFFFAVLGCSQASGTAPAPLDPQKYIVQQGWTPYVPVRKVTSPVPGIVPLTYFAKGSSAPSCALLVQTAAAPALIELSGPEQGESYPQCLAINEVATFTLNSREYLVFEYLSRETREDTCRKYYYVSKDASGRYIDAKELNGSEWAPPSISTSSTGANLPGAKDGITRARAILMAKWMTGMNFLGRDFLLDGTRSLSIFQDKAKTACTLVLDNGTRFQQFSHAHFSEGDTCGTVLASGKLALEGSTYYIAMFKGTSKTHLGVIAVNGKDVVTAEKEVAIIASKPGKLATMKDAKAALAAALK